MEKVIYKLHFFKKSTGICGDDFKSKIQVDTINLNFLLSLSDLQKFVLPFSGTFVGKFASVTMSNNDIYFIDEKSFVNLSIILNKSLIDI